jgi:hypothetical protein
MLWYQAAAPWSSADHKSKHTREEQIKLLELALKSTHRLYPIRYCALPLLLAVKTALVFLQNKTKQKALIRRHFGVYFAWWSSQILTFIFRRLFCVTNGKAFQSGGSTSCCWRFVQSTVKYQTKL